MVEIIEEHALAFGAFEHIFIQQKELAQVSTHDLNLVLQSVDNKWSCTGGEMSLSLFKAGCQGFSKRQRSALNQDRVYNIVLIYDHFAHMTQRPDKGRVMTPESAPFAE